MNSNKFASHAIATRLTNTSTTLAATMLQISHHTTQEVKRVSQSKHRCHASQLDLKKTHCHKHIKIHTEYKQGSAVADKPVRYEHAANKQHERSM